MNLCNNYADTYLMHYLRIETAEIVQGSDVLCTFQPILIDNLSGVESVSMLTQNDLFVRGILVFVCYLLGQGGNVNLELAAFYILCKLLVTV